MPSGMKEGTKLKLTVRQRRRRRQHWRLTGLLTGAPMTVRTQAQKIREEHGINAAIRYAREWAKSKDA